MKQQKDIAVENEYHIKINIDFVKCKQWHFSYIFFIIFFSAETSEEEEVEEELDTEEYAIFIVMEEVEVETKEDEVKEYATFAVITLNCWHDFLLCQFFWALFDLLLLLTASRKLSVKLNCRQ